MHLQLFHTNHFFIKSITKSNRPYGIYSYNSDRKKDNYYNCLVIFTSIEQGDSEISCRNAAKEIVKVYNDIRSFNKCNELAIIPYSHQCNIETNAKRALKLLDMVYEKVKELLPNTKVYFGDFGFNNEWEINVKSHKLSCLYRKI